MYSCFIELIKQVGEKGIKCEACRAFYHFSANSFNRSSNVRFYLSYDIKITLKSHFGVKMLGLCHMRHCHMGDIYRMLPNL